MKIVSPKIPKHRKGKFAIYLHPLQTGGENHQHDSRYHLDGGYLTDLGARCNEPIYNRCNKITDDIILYYWNDALEVWQEFNDLGYPCDIVQL